MQLIIPSWESTPTETKKIIIDTLKENNIYYFLGNIEVKETIIKIKK